MAALTSCMAQQNFVKDAIPKFDGTASVFRPLAFKIRDYAETYKLPPNKIIALMEANANRCATTYSTTSEGATSDLVAEI